MECLQYLKKMPKIEIYGILREAENIDEADNRVKEHYTKRFFPNGLPEKFEDIKSITDYFTLMYAIPGFHGVVSVAEKNKGLPVYSYIYSHRGSFSLSDVLGLKPWELVIKVSFNLHFYYLATFRIPLDNCSFVTKPLQIILYNFRLLVIQIKSNQIAVFLGLLYQFLQWNCKKIHEILCHSIAEILGMEITRRAVILSSNPVTCKIFDHVKSWCLQA